MILVSAGLVLAAIVLLIAGIVLGKVFLVMWSIVLSVLSAVFLVIAALLWRHKLFPGGGRAGAQAPVTPSPGAQAPMVQAHAHAGGYMGAPTTASAATAPMVGTAPGQTATIARTHSHPYPSAGPLGRPAPSGISPDAIVLVVPGRKRYHVAGCRQLLGKQLEQLTYEEAREEGFTPCTTCLPDAALGGLQTPPSAEPDQPAEAAFHSLGQPGATESQPTASAPSGAAFPSSGSVDSRGPLDSPGFPDRPGFPDSPSYAAPPEAAGSVASSGPSASTPSSGPSGSPGSSGPSGPTGPSAGLHRSTDSTGRPGSDVPADSRLSGAETFPPGAGRPEPPAVGRFAAPISIPPATSRSTGGWFASKSPGAGQQDPSSAAESYAEASSAPGLDMLPNTGESDPVASAQGRPSDPVKVIVGTHRFHAADCPLIRAMDDIGLESTTRADAERAGLTKCVVCLDV
ncbi:hypothetical protein [Sinosporangium siamense]|uniref:Uncharacterized protein n=1 Tax=Sinosporangium siamense TaxID=1367973 RepID=A0A919V2V8_9ACTN|nr:hypothetical protein [Sinosporangium siamense]GII90330.1 hypothetical protein Ssi02_05610 [Sinosporangium siamense]